MADDGKDKDKALPPKLAELVETTTEQHDQRALAEERLVKELKAFSEGLPYNRERIIERTQEACKRGLMAYYDLGRGLILLHEYEGQTFIQIIEAYFPGISLPAAKNYMRFARTAAKLPNFKAFCEASGGWSKGLTMLTACTEEELQEIEDSGELRGYKPDEIAMMSVRQMQRALRNAEASKEKAVATATHKLSQEKANLEDKVKGLEEELEKAPTQEDKALVLVKSADRKVMEAGALLGKISPELLGAHPTLVHLVLGVCGTAMRVLQGLEDKALAAYAAGEGMEPEEVVSDQ